VVALAAAALTTVALALRPGALDFDPPVTNPVGVHAAGLLDALATAGQALALAALVLAAVGLARRLARARGAERQQLKWMAYAASLVALAFAVNALGPTTGPLADLLWLVALLAFLGVPLAAGIAILRHRLYEIDLVINRTLVYGALTATLAATYLATVLLLGLALADSDLAVAGATLATAALARPARARIQAAVDRRFYRRRYDAQRTLDAFAARLRDEVDLDELAADLRAVAHETLQPAHVSVWLR